ncbi:uncharacterized protein BXZ73DRAFT_74474 [Epithele typhae]|uniref:uncharacterized protein n=1 Tax=Epithele typhae TaxID=378194 RepID=UPI0020085162|nr:uncharacterized protein BXZ73DRAFT_74474 [Epithele typhae]KAH9942165.1 hypothetical protein BXZ73DRAFT_74474 [Epithele typhae]
MNTQNFATTVPTIASSAIASSATVGITATVFVSSSATHHDIDMRPFMVVLIAVVGMVVGILGRVLWMSRRNSRQSKQPDIEEQLVQKPQKPQKGRITLIFEPEFSDSSKADANQDSEKDSASSRLASLKSGTASGALEFARPHPPPLQAPERAVLPISTRHDGATQWPQEKREETCLELDEFGKERTIFIDTVDQHEDTIALTIDTTPGCTGPCEHAERRATLSFPHAIVATHLHRPASTLVHNHEELQEIMVAPQAQKQDLQAGF